jgi:hypothetical protein
MHVSYRSKHEAYYNCIRHLMECTEQTCHGLKAEVIDELVSQQLLRALEPAALELSLQTCDDIQRERERLAKHWKQRLDRARYDVQLAERRYQAVDPENRLVAATLEQRWEEVLHEQRKVQEEYDRFVRESPRDLSEEERSWITALASDLPGLWTAATTTNVDRQSIIRCLVDRVVVHVRENTEYVDATIHWAGGYVSQHEIIRPVLAYEQLRDLDQLMNRIVELRRAGHTAAKIAKTLDAEGFAPPKRRGSFNSEMVRGLMLRRGLRDERRDAEILEPGEWWLKDLADKLNMPRAKLRGWAHRGWVHSRTTPAQGLWIVWADDDELTRLRTLRAQSQRGVTGHAVELTTPKTRISEKG